MKNKNLLFLCPSYPAVGGVETVTCLLTDFFLDKGFNVHLLVSSTEKRCCSILDRHTGLMTAMPGVSNSKENLSFIDRFIREKDIACVLNQGVFSEGYRHADCHKDVIFINVLHSCPFWEIKQFRNKSLRESFSAEKNKLRKLKLPLRYVLSRIKPELSNPFLSSFYKHQIDASKYYVVLDQSYKTLLEKRLYNGIMQEKIKVIPDPVILSDEKTKHKEKIVLYVGRLHQEPKRVDRLLRIWTQVEGKAPDWKLQIVGDGPHRSALERMSAKLHLSRVSFLGWQNPDAFYNSASIVCLTSTYEGFGMVLTEAQSHSAVPVVFDCSEAFSSIIDQNVSGIIVQSFDEDDFAKKLLSLMKDEEYRQTMSRHAREKASAFNIEKIGKLWLDLLK